MLDQPRPFQLGSFVRFILLSIFICACVTQMSSITYMQPFDPWQSKQPTSPDPPQSNSTTPPGAPTQEQVNEADIKNRQLDLSHSEKGPVNYNQWKLESMLREQRKKEMLMRIATYNKNTVEILKLATGIKQAAENSNDGKLPLEMEPDTNNVEKLSHQLRVSLAHHKLPAPASVNAQNVYATLNPGEQNSDHQRLLEKCIQYLQTAKQLKQAMDLYVRNNYQFTVSVEGLQTTTNKMANEALISDIMKKAEEMELLSLELSHNQLGAHR